MAGMLVSTFPFLGPTISRSYVDLCEKDYSRSSDLKRHKNQKHGNISLNVNNSQPHSTTSQPQSTTSQPFSTTVNLVNKKMKTKCKDPVCNKTFTRNSDMLRHYKISTLLNNFVTNTYKQYVSIYFLFVKCFVTNIYQQLISLYFLFVKCYQLEYLNIRTLFNYLDKKT